MARKTNVTVTGDGTTTIALSGQGDTVYCGGTWSTASVEIRSKPTANSSWYIVEETAQTANFNWSPSAGTGRGIYIDVVVTGGGSPSLDIIHLSN